MAFTAKDVAALREKTGCGMMDCKKALTATDGNMEAALDFLREKGLAAAEKKAGRIAAEGVAHACTNADGTVGVVVEINAETDFVAKNDDFKAFVQTVADTIINENPADIEALLACKAAGTEQTVAELLQEKILTIGENIKIRRFVRYEGHVVTYNHGAGRMGVAVQFDTTDEIAAKPEFNEYAKDVAMQVAALIPQYVDEAGVPAEIVEHEKKILTELCLVDQPFVKDGDVTVKQYTENTAKALGGDIKIVAFTRYEKGEGLEKKEDNFADEVASMIK